MSEYRNAAHATTAAVHKPRLFYWSVVARGVRELRARAVPVGARGVASRTSTNLNIPRAFRGANASYTSAILRVHAHAR